MDPRIPTEQSPELGEGAQSWGKVRSYQLGSCLGSGLTAGGPGGQSLRQLLHLLHSQHPTSRKPLLTSSLEHSPHAGFPTLARGLPCALVHTCGHISAHACVCYLHSSSVGGSLAHIHVPAHTGTPVYMRLMGYAPAGSPPGHLHTQPRHE